MWNHHYKCLIFSCMSSDFYVGLNYLGQVPTFLNSVMTAVRCSWTIFVLPQSFLFLPFEKNQYSSSFIVFLVCFMKL